MNRTGLKRKSTGSPECTKRPRVKSTEVITIEDSEPEEEDLSIILAQIQELEERERRLEDPYAPGPSRVHSKASPKPAPKRSTIEIEDSDDDIEIVGSSSKLKSYPTITISDDEIELCEQLVDPPTPPLLQSPPPRKHQRLLLRCEEPPDITLAQYRDFFIGEKFCSKCKKAVTPPRGHVMFKGDTKLPNSLVRLLHAPCSSCRTNHCRGCMKQIPCTLACTGNPKKGECTVADCCAAVRAMALFEALGGLDRLILGERSTSETRVAQLAEKGKKTTNNSVGPGGTGYGTGAGGYARRLTSTSNNTTKRPTRAEGLAKHWDELVVRAFHVLVELLPNPFAETAHEFDFIPHESIGLLFSFSRTSELLASLLRNDSVIDWTTRAEVYQAMMTLLRKLADCELTITLLVESRYSAIETCGLEPWMWKEGEIEWRRTGNGDIDKDPPLHDYFKRLVKQGETFLASASQLLDSQTNQDEQDATIQAVSLCGDIIAAAGDIERTMDLLNVNETTGTEATTNGSASLDKVYAEACERIAFKHVVLSTAGPQGSGLAYPNFQFASELQGTENSVRMPKNQFRLASELAVMATSLPAGVWVRVDEVRNDAIKFIIAGPEGTPYEGGLFEFDCLMPLDYPNSPPRVHLRTTGGGKVRFNPNLYNCGKVCLSLLGTWPGRAEEQWSSTKSTLLQVIISIQSMIFIEAPYFNEPGFGAVNMNSPSSISYNKEVSYNTVRWGILDWLEEDNLSGMWKVAPQEVVVSHFMIKSESIRQKVIDWSASDERLANLTINSKKTPALQEFDKRIALLDSKLF